MEAYGVVPRRPPAAFFVLTGVIALTAVAVVEERGLHRGVPLLALIALVTPWISVLTRWRTLLSGLLLIILFVPMSRYTLGGALPFKLEPYRIYVAALALGWLLSILVDRRVRLRRSAFDAPLLTILGISVLSEIANPSRVKELFSVVLKGQTFFISFFVVYFLIISLVRTRLGKLEAGGGLDRRAAGERVAALERAEREPDADDLVTGARQLERAERDRRGGPGALLLGRGGHERLFDPGGGLRRPLPGEPRGAHGHASGGDRGPGHEPLRRERGALGEHVRLQASRRRRGRARRTARGRRAAFCRPAPTFTRPNVTFAPAFASSAAFAALPVRPDDGGGDAAGGHHRQRAVAGVGEDDRARSRAGRGGGLRDRVVARADERDAAARTLGRPRRSAAVSVLVTGPGELPRGGRRAAEGGGAGELAAADRDRHARDARAGLGGAGGERGARRSRRADDAVRRPRRPLVAGRRDDQRAELARARARPAPPASRRSPRTAR